MHASKPDEKFTVLAHTTGDGYYDVGRYMPSDRVREAEADWLKWREDAQRAIKGIDSTIGAAEGAIIKAKPDAAKESALNIVSGNLITKTYQDPVHVLITAQRDAIEVAKAHLKIAIEGQESAARQAEEEKARSERSQRQARIANYLAAAAFLVAALVLFSGN